VRSAFLPIGTPVHGLNGTTGEQSHLSSKQQKVGCQIRLKRVTVSFKRLEVKGTWLYRRFSTLGASDLNDGARELTDGTVVT